jgi:hypothetical protein
VSCRSVHDLQLTVGEKRVMIDLETLISSNVHIIIRKASKFSWENVQGAPLVHALKTAFPRRELYCEATRLVLILGDNWEELVAPVLSGHLNQHSVLTIAWEAHGSVVTTGKERAVSF